MPPLQWRSAQSNLAKLMKSHKMEPQRIVGWDRPREMSSHQPSEQILRQRAKDDVRWGTTNGLIYMSFGSLGDTLTSWVLEAREEQLLTGTSTKF